MPNPTFGIFSTAIILYPSFLIFLNKEYKFFYNSEANYAKSSEYSINPFENFYSSKSLQDSDRDTSYQHTTAFKRMFYEGVKNTSDTTIDGDLPFIVTQPAPTVAVPTTKGISKLSVNQSNEKKKVTPKRRKTRRRNVRGDRGGNRGRR